MGDVGWGIIPYAEIIDDETEGDVAGAVSEQARGVGGIGGSRGGPGAR